jgi:16S rRNA C1402 (ribose-2'-O) methylase RsmI
MIQSVFVAESFVFYLLSQRLQQTLTEAEIAKQENADLRADLDKMHQQFIAFQNKRRLYMYPRWATRAPFSRTIIIGPYHLQQIKRRSHSSSLGTQRPLGRRDDADRRLLTTLTHSEQTTYRRYRYPLRTTRRHTREESVAVGILYAVTLTGCIVVCIHPLICK